LSDKDPLNGADGAGSVVPGAEEFLRANAKL
jgi:hypothetical protein